MDSSADKMPHKIPRRMELEDENAIIIYDSKIDKRTTITEESEIIKNLSEKIDIKTIYCKKDKSNEARKIMQSVYGII